ncbi:hypothetical protein Ciccas_000183 [Cichlidogyrus casuarinus]|uniref:Uncharacterized protein n=1 Tax=Cichlidogyrus casuarinus TaxID=1844966 RepID=A0ABD2QNQ6_9PLAT
MPFLSKDYINAAFVDSKDVKKDSVFYNHFLKIEALKRELLCERYNVDGLKILIEQLKEAVKNDMCSAEEVAQKLKYSFILKSRASCESLFLRTCTDLKLEHRHWCDSVASHDSLEVVTIILCLLILLKGVLDGIKAAEKGEDMYSNYKEEILKESIEMMTTQIDKLMSTDEEKSEKLINLKKEWDESTKKALVSETSLKERTEDIKTMRENHRKQHEYKFSLRQLSSETKDALEKRIKKNLEDGKIVTDCIIDIFCVLEACMQSLEAHNEKSFEAIDTNIDKSVLTSEYGCKKETKINNLGVVDQSEDKSPEFLCSLVQDELNLDKLLESEDESSNGCMMKCCRKKGIQEDTDVEEKSAEAPTLLS